MPYPKPGAEKGIWRFERSGAHRGYMGCVRIPGKSINKYFGKKQYGGIEGAYQAAIEWRNRTESELGIVRTNRRLDVKRGLTKTGMAGIRWEKCRLRVGIKATVPDDGQRSEQETLERAVELRNRLRKVCVEFTHLWVWKSEAQHMPYTKPGAEKGIHRIEREKSTRGYSACVRHQGQALRKLFSDSKHGGDEGARKAAIRWRNKTERKLGIVRTNRRLDMNSKFTPTGIAGVRQAKRGYTVEVSATIRIDKGLPEKKALAKAVKLRQRLLEVCAEFV